jgi:hypothetical protein
MSYILVSVDFNERYVHISKLTSDPAIIWVTGAVKATHIHMISLKCLRLFPRVTNYRRGVGYNLRRPSAAQIRHGQSKGECLFAISA